MSDQKSYPAALYAMQSGVAIKMNYDGSETTPKHLRVGVNAAMCDQAGLVRLLIAKGLISEAEYHEAITTEMNAEVERYETTLSEMLGGVTKVKLG